MAENKTQPTDRDVVEYLSEIESEKKRKDCLELKEIFDKVTGLDAVVWGDGMIGYGSYHYKSDRSSQEGDWPLTGFAPRKQNITVFIMPGFSKYDHILEGLGKYKLSKGSCLYINKLADVDQEKLELLIVTSVDDMRGIYNVN